MTILKTETTSTSDPIKLMNKEQFSSIGNNGYYKCTHISILIMEKYIINISFYQS